MRAPLLRETRGPSGLRIEDVPIPAPGSEVAGTGRHAPPGSAARRRLLLRSHDVVGVDYGGPIPADPGMPAHAAAETFGWLASGRMTLPAGPAGPPERGPAVLQAFADRAVVGKPGPQVRPPAAGP